MPAGSNCSLTAQFLSSCWSSFNHVLYSGTLCAEFRPKEFKEVLLELQVCAELDSLRPEIVHRNLQRLFAVKSSAVALWRGSSDRPLAKSRLSSSVFALARVSLRIFRLNLHCFAHDHHWTYGCASGKKLESGRYPIFSTADGLSLYVRSPLRIDVHEPLYFVRHRLKGCFTLRTIISACESHLAEQQLICCSYCSIELLNCLQKHQNGKCFGRVSSQLNGLEGKQLKVF